MVQGNTGAAKNLKFEKLKYFVLKWTAVGLLIFFLYQGWLTHLWFNYGNPPRYEYTKQEIDWYEFDLTQYPEGEVIWIGGIGPKNFAGDHDYYQVAIYNVVTNKIHRITVPSFVAFEMRRQKYFIPDPFKKQLDVLEFLRDSINSF